MNRLHIPVGILLSAAAVICGCSQGEAPRLVPFKGFVKMNGKGVTAGSIYLHPGSTAEYTKDNPSSILQTDGGFNVKTYPFGEGVAPGEYIVTLAPELAQRLKQPAYGSVAKSPWKIVVPVEGKTDVVLEID